MSMVFWVETRGLEKTDDSEVLVATVFRAEEYAKEDTNRNRRQALNSSQLKRSTSCYSVVTACLSIDGVECSEERTDFHTIYSCCHFKAV
jgi:hypothetical protein